MGGKLQMVCRKGRDGGRVELKLEKMGLKLLFVYAIDQYI